MARLCISFIAFCLLVGAALGLGGWFSHFIDIPSILIVLGGAYAMTLMSFTNQEILRSISCTWSGTNDRNRLRLSLYLWKCIIRNMLTVGVIGNLIGAVLMLQKLDDPNAIGSATAVCLLTTYYPVVLITALLIPAIYLVKYRLASLPNHEEELVNQKHYNSIPQTVIGYVLFLALVAGAMGDGRMSFLDYCSALIVFGGALGVGIVTINLPNISIYRWQMLTVTFFMLALVAGVIGFIVVLYQSNDPTEVGPGMAIVLLSSLYALLGVSLISYPKEDRCVKASGDYESLTLSQAVWIALPLQSFFWLILGISILFAMVKGM